MLRSESGFLAILIVPPITLSVINAFTVKARQPISAPLSAATCSTAYWVISTSSFSRLWQERIQKDIDVVIQKSRAEKDCLFADFRYSDSTFTFTYVGGPK
ncbi:hypothetical protein STEG23_035408, partial [Scotinomys teguina]